MAAAEVHGARARQAVARSHQHRLTQGHPQVSELTRVALRRMLGGPTS